MRSTCDGGRVLRGRGAAEDGALARPDSPRRCTLPMTALRVMPPSSAAIWLADNPSDHSRLSCSTRSSVQLISLRSPFPIMGTSPSRVACGERCPRRNPPTLSGSHYARPTLHPLRLVLRELSAARDVVFADPKAKIPDDSRWRSGAVRV